MRTYWNFRGAGQLTFGRGAVRQLGRLAVQRGLSRVLIVTDRILVGAGIVDHVVRALDAAGVGSIVFDEGEAEPALELAERGAQLARAERPQGILGLGGGSNMDLAKIIAVLHAHGGSPRDYFSFDRVPGPIAPLICVPTTAGTGSEVSHAAVLTDAQNKLKVSTLSQYLRPALALVDPELTYSCPPKVTADSGIDALTHAIEACTAVDYDQLPVGEHEEFAYEGRFPLGDCLADKAIELVGRHLLTAVREPHDVAAREGMALAATLAGLAFSNEAVALVHGLEYPLGGALHVSHGAGNGLLLPHVMRFNLPGREATFARIARLLGENVDGLSDAAAAERAIEAVDRLRAAIGVPGRIRDLGGTAEQLPELAAKAFSIKRLLTMNPRAATEADLLGIYQAAY